MYLDPLKVDGEVFADGGLLVRQLNNFGFVVVRSTWRICLLWKLTQQTKRTKGQQSERSSAA